MIKITKDHLAKKTDAQLAALFQEASKAVPALQEAQSLIAMIRAELTRRGPRP